MRNYFRSFFDKYDDSWKPPESSKKSNIFFKIMWALSKYLTFYIFMTINP